MVELDLTALHRDAAPCVASFARYDQRRAGRSVYVLDVVAVKPCGATTIEYGWTSEFVERRVAYVEFAAVIFYPGTAVEERSAFEANLLSCVFKPVPAVEIHRAIRDRDILKMIEPRAAMNFISVAEAVDVVLPVGAIRCGAGKADRVASSSGTDQLDIFETRDTSRVGAVG